MQTDFDEAALRATVTFQPLPAFCYDPSGRIAVWIAPRSVWMAFVSIGEHRRARALYPGDLGHPRALLFARQVEMTFSAAFWREMTAEKRAPFRVSLSVVRLGRTSWVIGGDLETTAAAAGAETPLMTYVAQMVHVDSESRRPAPLPGWFRETHRHLEGRPSAGPPRFRRPFDGAAGAGQRRSFRYEVTPGASSLDASRHVNQSEMVRFCSDALAAGLGSVEEEVHGGGGGGHSGGGHGGDLGGVAATWSSQWLQTLSLLYVGEAFAGDALTIESWAGGAERPSSAFFKVSKRGRPIMESVWEFCDHGARASRAKL